MSKTKDILNQLDEAIDNNWPMRALSTNNNFAQKGKLSDRSVLINSRDDLNAIDCPVTGFAIIPGFIEDFISIDVDLENKAFEAEFWSLLNIYRKKDLFLRKGNKKRVGQLWFKTESKTNFKSGFDIDLITNQKRCNALGQYKEEDGSFYEWPYKKFWEHTPDDLPLISETLIGDILDLASKYSDKKPVKNIKEGSRHDQLREFIGLKLRSNARFLDVVKEIKNHDAYKSLANEGKRNVDEEVSRLIEWSAKNEFENHLNIKEVIDSGEKSIVDIFNIPSEHPEVEKNSPLDVIYNAIRRNQVVESKKMAFVTALSICSWICSMPVRFRGICPNLYTLLIAPSGSGKSTSGQAIKEVIKIDKKLKATYQGQDIRTDSAVFSSIQESPVSYWFIDEATKIIQSSKNKNSHNQNISEILCQLYSDFKDNDPPNVLAKTKNESYGVSIGAKAVLHMCSTPSFFDTFSEDMYTKGLGRRTTIFLSSDIPLQKKNKKYYKEFFFHQEEKYIAMFLNSLIGNHDLFQEVDIEDYNIVREISSKDGIKEVKKYKKCKKPNIRFDITCTDEVDEFLRNEFVEMNNNYKIQSASMRADIYTYAINGFAETVLKMAIIHCVCGKKLEAEGDTATSLRAKINTVMGMDSINWAINIYKYYIFGGTVEQLSSLYGKDREMSESNTQVDMILEKLKENNVKRFKKSHPILKSIFKAKGGASKRDRTLKEMELRKLVKINGDLDSYGCDIEVL